VNSEGVAGGTSAEFDAGTFAVEAAFKMSDPALSDFIQCPYPGLSVSVIWGEPEYLKYLDRCIVVSERVIFDVAIGTEIEPIRFHPALSVMVVENIGSPEYETVSVDGNFSQ
jgi:hypothetical protein